MTPYLICLLVNKQRIILLNINIILENEPLEFGKAAQMSENSGDMTHRARERIRSHSIIQPVWKKINKGSYYNLYRSYYIIYN